MRHLDVKLFKLEIVVPHSLSSIFLSSHLIHNKKFISPNIMHHFPLSSNNNFLRSEQKKNNGQQIKLRRALSGQNYSWTNINLQIYAIKCNRFVQVNVRSSHRCVFDFYTARRCHSETCSENRNRTFCVTKLCSGPSDERLGCSVVRLLWELGTYISVRVVLSDVGYTMMKFWV